MTKVPFSKKIDFFIFGNILKWFYPEYYVSKYSSKKYFKIFLHYLIPQKLFWLNGSVKWPVHFTSTILSSQNIKKGILCDPGDNPNVYIEANNGIVFGSNVGIGTGTKILSSIHSHDNHSLYDVSPPIIIGNNVFIGANSIILRGINIGDNVVVGAGSIVTKDIPSNSIALGNPCKVVKKKGPYIEDLSKIEFNRKVPNKYLTFLNGFN